MTERNRHEPIRVLDLFSGIGGFTLGLESTGHFKTLAFCEKDPFCRKVLNKHWQGVPVYDDITNARFTESVDMVTAGFPCQDISLAGKGAGLTGERSGLYWHILRTLRMVGRKVLLLENVAGLLVRGLGTVLGSLAEIGYDTGWHCLPAYALGAPHRRDRIWIIAHPECIRLQRRNGQDGLQKEILFEELPALLGRCQKRTDRPWNNLPASRICRSHDGIPNRTHRLKALGNAIVPQIPELLGEAIYRSGVFQPSPDFTVAHLRAPDSPKRNHTMKQANDSINQLGYILDEQTKGIKSMIMILNDLGASLILPLIRRNFGERFFSGFYVVVMAIGALAACRLFKTDPFYVSLYLGVIALFSGWHLLVIRWRNKRREEFHTRYEGDMLPFIKYLPAGSNYWWAEGFYEPLLTFLTGICLQWLDVGLGTLFMVSAFLMFIRSRFYYQEYRNKLLDERDRKIESECLMDAIHGKDAADNKGFIVKNAVNLSRNDKKAMMQRAGIKSEFLA